MKLQPAAANCHHLCSLTMHMVHLVFDTAETCKNIPWVMETSSSFSLFRLYKIWAVNLFSYQNPSVAAYKLLQRLHHLLPVLCLLKVGVTSSVSLLHKKKKKQDVFFLPPFIALRQPGQLSIFCCFLICFFGTAYVFSAAQSQPVFTFLPGFVEDASKTSNGEIQINIYQLGCSHLFNWKIKATA